MESEDARPWELPGNFRRDYEPRRSALVETAGAISLVCGLLSLAFVPVGLAVFDLSVATVSLLGVLGMPMGIAAWAMARQDLAKMRVGLIHPADIKAIFYGRSLGLAGTILCAACLLMLGQIWAFIRFVL